MEDIAQKIELYHNLFLGSLVLCILCIIIAAVVFFLLDIRSTLGYLTGRRAKKQIQKLKESNAASGRLIPRERTGMQYVAQEMKQDMGVNTMAAPGAREVDNVIQQASQTTVLNNEEDGASATTVLNSGSGGGESETTLLKENGGHQAGDSREEKEDTSTVQLQEEVHIGTFRLEREIILIHTDEVI